MKTIVKIIINGAICGIIIGIFIYYIVLPIMIPKIIERRARDLGLMQYSGGEFVAKDSLSITKWDLYYLQYGHMNGY